MQEVLSQGDKLKTVELAQLAQVDLAMRLEVAWYSERTWLEDGQPADLLAGIYWLGSARYAPAIVLVFVCLHCASSAVAGAVPGVSECATAPFAAAPYPRVRDTLNHVDPTIVV